VADRFTNPENAAAATMAAAAESEFGASIDENIQDEVLTAQEVIETVDEAVDAQEAAPVNTDGQE